MESCPLGSDASQNGLTIRRLKSPKPRHGKLWISDWWPPPTSLPVPVHFCMFQWPHISSTKQQSDWVRILFPMWGKLFEASLLLSCSTCEIPLANRGSEPTCQQGGVLQFWSAKKSLFYRQVPHEGPILTKKNKWSEPPQLLTWECIPVSKWIEVDNKHISTQFIVSLAASRL